MRYLNIFALCLAITLAPMRAQSAAINPEYEGIWEGYNGEWEHVTRELIDLAQAIPADKYSWRPAPGVRSVSEVYMHIALSNFYLLAATGPKVPPDMEADDMEKKVTSKAEVIEILNRSLTAVKTARAQLKPGYLQHKVEIEGKAAPVDGRYVRIIIHDNEHMGQLIAYARVNKIVPPWSRG
jgi:uncharacterized damage-inducible protein DinB